MQKSKNPMGTVKRVNFTPPRCMDIHPSMARIGLLGGSFNPAHGGHRRLSVDALRRLGLDEVWWLVSPGNPLKSDKDMAPLAARFLSARRAARNAPIRPTVIEAELGTRFTLDTLRRLKRRYPR